MSLCQMYFAPPGAGKTTLAVAKAQKFLRKGYTVFTNFPCAGCYRIDSATIGKYHFKGVCIIDEAGIDFNNRNWKNFSNAANEYVKLHRHYGTDFLFFSQGWDDCDKKIRTLCTEYYYLHKPFKKCPITIYRLMAKRVGVDETTKQIIDEYYKVSIWSSGLHFLWRPRWYKYFDSWAAPELPAPPLELWNFGDDDNDYQQEREKMISLAQKRYEKSVGLDAQ